MRGLPLDLARIREALKGPGIDTRYWASYGTVGTVSDEGTPDFMDANAVHVASDGTYVDVVLMPTQVAVTCRYPGVQGGSGVLVATPIRPGDEVLVVLPDGSPNGPPVVAAVLNSASSKVPLGDDRRPLFQNDRVLVYAGGDVPIDLRTEGGARVEVRQGDEVVVTGATVRLGDESASQAVLRGNAYRTAEKTFLDAFKVYIAAIQPIADPPGLVTGVMTTATDLFKVAGDAFSGKAKVS